MSCDGRSLRVNKHTHTRAIDNGEREREKKWELFDGERNETLQCLTTTWLENERKWHGTQHRNKRRRKKRNRNRITLTIIALLHLQSFCEQFSIGDSVCMCVCVCQTELEYSFSSKFKRKDGKCTENCAQSKTKWTRSATLCHIKLEYFANLNAWMNLWTKFLCIFIISAKFRQSEKALHLWFGLFLRLDFFLNDANDYAMSRARRCCVHITTSKRVQ